MNTHNYPAWTVLKSRKWPVKHYGIVLPNGLILHASRSRGGVVATDLAAFGTDGLKVVAAIQPLLPEAEMLRRVEALKGKPYHLFRSNCEHLVRAVTGHPIESEQLQRVKQVGKAVASVAMLALLITRVTRV